MMHGNGEDEIPILDTRYWSDNERRNGSIPHSRYMEPGCHLAQPGDQDPDGESINPDYQQMAFYVRICLAMPEISMLLVLTRNRCHTFTGTVIPHLKTAASLSRTVGATHGPRYLKAYRQQLNGYTKRSRMIAAHQTHYTTAGASTSTSTLTCTIHRPVIRTKWSRGVQKTCRMDQQ